MSHSVPKYLPAFICLLLLFNYSLAQQKISGIVVTDGNQPLSGATVNLKNSALTTITGSDGSFTLEAKKGDILEISFIGYKTQQIEITNESAIEVSLQLAINSLDEVVVTGYTSQKVKEITGSVSVVKTKDLVAIPAGQVTQMLQGRVAGLNVTTSGEPGTATTVRLHGVGNFGDVTPLYIIDGVPGDINRLNADDIESLQVLKDAAGYSIYGVRGANGVIVVTTKKGRQGKTRIGYDMYVGWQFPIKAPEVLTPQEYADLFWLAKRNSGDTLSNGYPYDPLYGNGPNAVLPDIFFAGPHKGGSFTDANADPSKYNIDPDLGGIYQIVPFSKTGTNWFDEMYSPAFRQKHTLSVSGGNDKNQYLVSLGYLDEQGTMLNTYLRRFTSRVNTEFNYKQNFRFGENIQLTFSENPRPYRYYPEVNHPDDLNAAVNTSPSLPVYDLMGAYNPLDYYLTMGPFDNPLARRVMAKDNKQSEWEGFGNLYAALDFLKYFTVKTSFGGSIASFYNKEFRPASYDNVSSKNRLSEVSGSRSSLTWTNTLNFSKIISDHSVKVLAGTEMVNNYNKEIGGASVDLPFTFPDYWLLNNGTPDPFLPNYSLEGISKLASFFARLDYGYNDRYFFSATIRNDGSSVFGPENRFGWFPAFAAAWRLSEEKFLQNTNWITELKLRASWGKTGFYGNTDPFNQYTLYGGTAADAYYDISGNSTGSIQRGYRKLRIGNPKTGWQEDVTTNLGLDAIFWNGKLSFNADWYVKESKGLLFKIELPDLLGDASPPNVNAGDIRNTGFDLSLGSKGSFSSTTRWDVLVTFSHYKNKVIKLNNVPFFDDAFGIIRNEVGYPISSFFGYKVIGLFQDEGDVSRSPTQQDAKAGRFKYADTNSRDSAGTLTGIPDGKIDDADRIHYGNPHPDFTVGLNIGITVGNFDISTFLYGSFGNDVFNGALFHDIAPFDPIGVASKTALYNSWAPNRKNAKAPIPEVIYNFSNKAPFHSYNLEDASYLKNKSLMLGYTFPRHILKRIQLEKLRIYVQVLNLFSITNYSGLDPETNRTGASPLSAVATNSAFGIDFGNYPNNQRQFYFGVTLGL